MKTNLFTTLLILFFVSTVYLPLSDAQDYTTWDLPEGAMKRIGKGSIDDIAYSPDGTRLAVASNIGIWIYDAQTGKELNLLFTGHTQEQGSYLPDVSEVHSVLSVSFSPDGQTLASGGTDKTIRLWDVRTGDLLRTLTGHTGSVKSVAFSPDGKTLASGGGGGIRLWDVRIGDTILTLTGYTVAFSPDGKTLASAIGKEIRLSDVRTGDTIHTLTGHWGYGPISVAFSPDGQTLATANAGWGVELDGIIHLWDVRTGDLLHTLTGHRWYERIGVSFSPDGQTLASASGDLRLWDVRTGDLLHTVPSSSGNAPLDLLTLASGSWAGTVLLWDLTPEPPRLAADINGDDEVNIQDLVAVAAAIGKVGENDADVNDDSVVNIQDLVAVAAALGEVAAAPAALRQQGAAHLTQEDVQHWITQARQLNLTDARTQLGILFLEQLLSAMIPKETALLPNYPNPFNPETWIPYQLATPADVALTIYDIQGRVVRDLDLGHQAVGIYENRSRAAYWDGRNAVGEPVASGVYFYTLTAGDFTATRKMLIRK